MDKTVDSGSTDGGSIPLGYIKGRKDWVVSDMANKPTGGLSGLLEKIKTDQKVRYGVIGGVLALILIVIIIICVSCSRKKDGQQSVSDNETAAVSEDTASAQGTLELTDNEALLQLVNAYYDALESGDSATVAALKSNVSTEEKIKLETKAEYMESIDNIQVYTRPGPAEGSYVAFIYYEIKFADIETKAPGLTTTYICTREDGSLYINNDEWDEATTVYIQQIASEQVVADFFNQVQVAYTEATNKDVALALFMENLPKLLEEAVAQRMQEAEQAANAEQPPAEPTPTPVNETVVTTDKVNVRASDSENADRIGQVEAGTALSRYETRDNGWSKIDYNGQEGYIKSEYLQVQGDTEAPVEEVTPEEPADTEQPAETEQSDSNTYTGKITAKESVRVRASASESGDVLGMVYQGETYNLIMEQADGWCKIDYNGTTGYVKRDYVEIN